VKRVGVGGGLLLAALVAAGQTRPERAQTRQLPVARTVLPDGLTVLTLEDHSLPSIAILIHFKVGSKNEVPGITGISHLFEHMMFNGSEKFPPKAFDHIIEAGGGYSDGQTDRDWTVYWEEFSPATLGKVLELEADRMRALKLDDQNIEQERGIVINERLVSYDNLIQGTMQERLWSEAFLASPYRWDAIGWIADLRKGIHLEDAKRYFRAYYTPNNAVMAIVGDFATAPTLDMVRALWANVPGSEAPRPVLDSEPPQWGEKRVIVEKEAQAPLLMVGYKTPGFTGARAADIPALEVLGTILGSGRSSPLYRRLVHDTGLCTEVSVDVPSMAMTALATFTLQLAPTKETAKVEAELYAILKKFQTDGVSAGELARAKNQIEVQFLRRLVGNSGRARAIAYYEALRGGWKAMYEELEAYQRTTPEDVRRVAWRYFVASNRTVAVLTPETPADAVDFGQIDAESKPAPQ
jgi:zinc protease